MKINGNHKNGTNKDSNESATDQLTKKAVSALEEKPLLGFDAASTWKKLAARLGNVDKRFVTWGFAMAASFSLLVAAKIELFDWTNQDNQPQKPLTEIQVVDKETVQLSAVPIKSSVVIEKIEPQSQALETTLKPSVEKNQTKIRPKTVLLAEKKDKRKLELYPLSNPFVSVFAKANFSSEGVTPEIGIDFKIAENYTAKRRDIYKLGLSSQVNFRTTEEGDKKIHPHTFVNLEFTSLNKKTNKGWTTRAGYLLNPDGYLYQDTTVKVSLFRNINKHIKIGPEVIFTDNLKSAYPSISLILG
ncbi:hypothetical protein SAMN04488029_3531 [Reichenbachiella faecimaris]|uniref:Uncharacterized protein n=1 Tax=Reichenbachiella faecimaris TaxID=692418 RepID=A0A1W2GMW1_REIFA|nr:hypothetical protein [Reichenbachiella faecimaris]SMD37904.1 hypothetical protein SAMN04488029_3531 [Reichenbachiella faecimaris]